MPSKLENAKLKTSQLSDGARQKARAAIDASKSAAGKTLETSKSIAENAKRKTGETVENSPLAMVAGGLAVGAIVAALLPKTEREKQLLGDAGRKINDTARNAAEAAKKAGKEHMEEVGLEPEQLRQQARDIFQKGFDTAKQASKAAQDTLKRDNNQ